MDATAKAQGEKTGGKMGKIGWYEMFDGEPVSV